MVKFVDYDVVKVISLKLMQMVQSAKRLDRGKKYAGVAIVLPA